MILCNNFDLIRQVENNGKTIITGNICGYGDFFELYTPQDSIRMTFALIYRIRFEEKYRYIELTNILNQFEIIITLNNTFTTYAKCFKIFEI